MKHKYLQPIAIAALMFTGAEHAAAQGMAINTTGASANTSAIVDVTSTAKGILIPRMTNAQRNAITSPATGLMVFQTDLTAGFYYYDGSTWTAVGGSGAPTGTAGGDLTGSYPNPTLPASGTSTGTFGSTTQNASVTVDARGIITGVSNVSIFNGQGTSTTILHGNAGGAPSFGAVSLANDVTGNLPVTNMNGGSGASSSTFWRGDGTWGAVSAGTVTSVSAGTLSPLFTTSVTNPTTTPAVSFSLTNSGAYTVFTNGTSSSAAPAYGKVDPNALYSTAGTPSSSTFYRGDGQWGSASATIPLIPINTGVGTSSTLASGTKGIVPLTAANLTITLPLANSVAAGTFIYLAQDGQGGASVQVQGSDKLHVPNSAPLSAGTPWSGAPSISFPINRYSQFVSDGSSIWYAAAFF